MRENNMILTLKNELNNYPFIKRYFSSLVYRVLQTSAAKQNVLIQLLSDEASRDNLEQLEDVLKLGDSYCRNFKRIFYRVKSLDPVSFESTNEVIYDTLAEVEAFEYLDKQNFTKIVYVPAASQRTVDFISYRNGKWYAIEASRLSLPQSQRKQVVPFFQNRIVEALYSKNADEPFFETLRSKIKAEYSQVKQFCQAQTDRYLGVVIISLGRKFFISRQTRHEFAMLPTTTQNTLNAVWQELKMNDDHPYLYQIVFVVGRNLTCTVQACES